MCLCSLFSHVCSFRSNRDLKRKNWPPRKSLQVNQNLKFFHQSLSRRRHHLLLSLRLRSSLAAWLTMNTQLVPIYLAWLRWTVALPRWHQVSSFLTDGFLLPLQQVKQFRVWIVLCSIWLYPFQSLFLQSELLQLLFTDYLLVKTVWGKLPDSGLKTYVFTDNLAFFFLQKT